jgi:hypothetical protein
MKSSLLSAGTILVITIFMCACQPSDSLSQETAEELVIEKWGDCEPGVCDELTVSILKEDDSLLVEALYEGMKDDSVRSQKRVAEVHLADGKWQIGETVLRTYICQSGRGQQEFGEELCK